MTDSKTSRSPLDEAHRQLGAVMLEREGWIVPASYGDAASEYEAVRGGASAGLIDLSARGRILLSGGEAVQFLNGLITNDVKTLEENSWMHAAFPNVQGRLIASVRVLRTSEGFLIDTEAATHERVLKTLERFTLAGDFKVTDLTEELALISVQGVGSAEVVRAAISEEASSIERRRARTTKWRESDLILARATHTGEDGFDLFVSAQEASALWDALKDAGARPIGYEALEVLRVEAGLPRYGVDIDESRVVLEAGLDEAVSFTKGCYIGQEIIARIHWRGHVAKKLTGLSFDAMALIEPGAKILSAEEREIGQITSCVFSPRLNRTIALGYVKYDFLAPGTEVRVVSDSEQHAARVSELPFVRGSWFRDET